MNFKVTPDSLWFRIGSFGLSVVPAKAETVDAWTVCQASAFGVKASIIKLP